MAKESTLKNLVVTLGLITLLSSAAVASIYALTQDAIEEAQGAKVTSAIREILPPFDSVKADTLVNDGEKLECFRAFDKNGKAVGAAVKTFSDNGFNGRIELMVGFLPGGDISGVAVIAQSETPGLGAKMADKPKEGKKPVFTAQFVGKNPADFKLSVTKDGGDVDAITASTISSRAFCDAVQRAYDALSNH